MQQHAIFSRFTPWAGKAPEPYFIHWIGDRTPADILGKEWTPNGRGPLNVLPFDEEYFEWIDLLEAAALAGPVFTFLELGAGYGRWSVRAALAARQLGKTARLGLVEIAPHRPPEIRRVMAANDIPESQYRLFEAAVGGRSKDVLFAVRQPPSQRGSAWYGQAVVDWSMTGAVPDGEFFGVPLWRLTNEWGVVKRAQISLSQVLACYDQIDLADFDLQGAEAEAIEEAIEPLSRTCRRLHIGTHGPDIEADLRVLLPRAGWICVRDYVHHRPNETPYGRIDFVDGVQTWVNSRFADSA